MQKKDLRYPLCWPIGWKRSKTHQKSRFDPKRSRTIASARDELLNQLRLLGAKNPILSSNLLLRQDGLPRSGQKEPEDPGVAVYFSLDGEQKVLACDQWDKVKDNFWAIAQHIDSMRGQLRWGVGNLNQAFAGYSALPASGEWWQILGVRPGASRDEVKLAYRRLSKEYHPDAGGDRAAWDALCRAYELGLKATA